MKAQRQLNKLDKPDRVRVKAYISMMAATENPLAFATKLVGDREDRWRWRVGSLRVLFTVFQDELIIDVVKIGRRGDVYD